MASALDGTRLLHSEIGGDNVLLGAHLADFLFTAGPSGDGFATIGVQRFPAPSLPAIACAGTLGQPPPTARRGMSLLAR
ncbi:hypothetical protein CV770_12170 [Bradyrhizobium sp. AC87j1]|nr:hypothetical protein CV770_12170 [Bradyrhizobium sp. AC87j1]